MSEPFLPFAPVETAPEPRPLFADTYAATLGYRLNPIIDRGVEAARFGTTREPGYNPLEDLPDQYIPYAADIYRATSPEHRAFILSSIDRGMETRRTLGESTFWAGLGAGMLDPINLIAIPIGPGSTLLRSAGRSALGVGMVEAGYEATVMQLDPVQTFQESATNVITTMFFGGAIGGLAHAPTSVQARNYRNIQGQMTELSAHMDRMTNLAGLTPEEIRAAPPPAERPFAELSNEELSERAGSLSAQAQALVARGDEANQGLTIDELNAEARGYRQELGLRQLEEINARGVDDPYGIMPNVFTESIFYSLVTTPMRRALQSNWGNTVKDAFYRTAGDHSIALGLNSLGFASPSTVFLRTQVSMGRVIQSYDSFVRIWAEETGATPSPVGAAISNVGRRVKRSNDTLEQWLESINDRRLRGEDNFSPREREVVNILNDYFLEAQARLEEVGLIGTRAGIENRIVRLEARVSDLQGRLNSASNRAAPIIGARLSELEAEIRFSRARLDSFDDGIIAALEPFNPRFWDHGAIRSNRQELFDIIYQYFVENPVIREYNPRTNRFEQVRLPTNREAVTARVNNTIDRILGEKDPTSLESVSFGQGRSKHFRTRELDIPNHLVTDFMHTDVMSVMKAYANRIEPRYEYSRMFGMEVDDVRLDLRLDMIEQGRSDTEINRMNRDYTVLYDRIAGTTRHTPDALSHKIADALREMASLNYLGSAGFAAVNDFSRIVMEYEMGHLVKGMQGMLDQTALSMSRAETRRSLQAVELTLNSTHMRLMSEGHNNFSNNNVINNARNAFFVMNLLGPTTVVLKQLAGIVDGHTIIDYSRRLARGELDEQSTIWLAKHGIDAQTAARIAETPFETTNYGLHLPNSQAWTSPERIRELAEARFNYSRRSMPVTQMSDAELSAHFSQQFNVDQIITDPRVVSEYFGRLREERGYDFLLGYATDMTDIDGTFNIHLDRAAIEQRFNSLKENAQSRSEAIEQLEEAYTAGRMSEEAYMHSRNEIEAIDLFETLDDYTQYILLHELHHTQIRRGEGESIADMENRIDQAAIAYMRAEREQGQAMALERQMEEIRIEQENLAETFRSALHSGVLNTIMSGTPADRPIITDGVAYIPMRVAKMFGMREDPTVTGYARIENGFLGLPFQFYNYALANVNRTMGAFAQGQIKNRVVGLSTALGLGYLITQFRTPDYIWDEMSWQDRFARSFDMSGVAALYSDLFYTGMHTSLALGGPDITGGFISPKFPQRQSLFDAATGLAGAGPSWLADVGEGMYEIYNGEYGDGARRIFRDLPFMRLWFIKDEVNQLTRAWAG